MVPVRNCLSGKEFIDLKMIKFAKIINAVFSLETCSMTSLYLSLAITGKARGSLLLLLKHHSDAQLGGLGVQNINAGETHNQHG